MRPSGVVAMYIGRGSIVTVLPVKQPSTVNC